MSIKPGLFFQVLLCFVLVGSVFTNPVNAHGLVGSKGSQTLVQDPPPLGQIGGSIKVIAIQGNYAYIGVGPRLVSLDISVPANPVFVGRSGILPGVVQDIAIAGDYAYVATGNMLSLVDISDPVHMIKVSSVATYATAVKVAGNYAYIAASGLGLRIVDISNPLIPVEVGYTYIEYGGAALELALAGNYAFVGGYGLLSIVDVSNPANPTEVASYRLSGGGGTFGVDVAGHFVYAAGISDPHVVASLHIIDISNPVAPVQAGSITTGDAEQVTVVGNFAYVINTSGLLIINISNVQNPYLVGSYGLHSYGLTYPIAVAGNYAYLVDNNQLLVLDLTNPAAPAKVGSFAILGRASGMEVKGNYAYVMDGDLNIIDVSDPTAMMEISSYDLSDTAWDVEVGDTYAYVRTTTDTGSGLVSALRVINITNPAAPTGVSQYPVTDGSYEYALSDKYIYIAYHDLILPSYTDDLGLRIIDFTTPTAPTVISSIAIDSLGIISSITVKNNYAYITDLVHGLHIIDVSNPHDPVEVSLYNHFSSAHGIVINGLYGYVLDDIGLHIVDLSDPTSPVEIGSYSPNYSPYDVVVSGDYAYVRDYHDLYILNVSNPSNPTLVGIKSDLYGSPFRLAVFDNYILVASEEAGLVEYPTAIPTSATITTAGGTLTSTPDQTTYSFPADTFTGSVDVTHRTQLYGNLSIGGLISIGHVFDTTAVFTGTNQSVQPDKPYSLTIQYTDAEKGSAIESTLALYCWDGQGWVLEPTSSVDPDDNTITATLDHFSLCTVLGETNQLFLPLLGY